MRTLYLVVTLGFAVPALAQQGAPTPRAGEDVDEVVVPGRRPQNLRAEIERLERVVYDRWNSLNSDNELDIHCTKSEPTGSNVTQTRCAPNFVIQAEARAAENSIDAARNNARAENSEYLATMEQKSRRLNEEMQRVARQDEQFLRDLVRLDELRQLQASEKEQRRRR